MQIKNPILPGFYPDPSICAANGKYYLVTSSFEYFPCIPIFESLDLVHWHQIGHVIDHHNAVTLRQGDPNRTGMYAPTIRFHKGRFYVVCTNVAYGEKDDGNFIVSTDDPNGPWSEPIFIDLPGIDPSLFFDADGSVYYTGTHGDIYICKIDVETGNPLETSKAIWAGTGGCAPEGPHIYKVNDWYYLMISEGGTEHGHMVTISRSKSPYGPYEAYENNPIMSNRSKDTPIKAAGHSDLVVDTFGQWWAVCLGIRTISYPFRHNLGRETMLVPVTWAGDWPVMGNRGIAEQLMILDRISATNSMNTHTENRVYDFAKTYQDLHWNYLYNPQAGCVEITDRGLMLLGNANTLSDPKPMAWYGRRQCHHICSVEATVSFDALASDEAGLSVYLNHKHHYEIALTRLEGVSHIILRRQIGTLKSIEKKVPYDAQAVTFKIEADKENYQFYYKSHDTFEKIGEGETQYLTTEVGGYFTGNYFALYATGHGEDAKSPAVFRTFRSEERRVGKQCRYRW